MGIHFNVQSAGAERSFVSINDYYYYYYSAQSPLQTRSQLTLFSNPIHPLPLVSSTRPVLVGSPLASATSCRRGRPPSCQAINAVQSISYIEEGVMRHLALLTTFAKITIHHHHFGQFGEHTPAVVRVQWEVAIKLTPSSCRNEHTGLPIARSMG